ncbi:MAG: hypothetical protein ABL871_10040 [Terricaulis sp.]
MSRAIVNPNNDKKNRNQGRDERNPKYSAHIAGEERHQRDCDQRTSEGAGGVERLAEAIGAAAYFQRRHIGHQRIARRLAQHSAHPPLLRGVRFRDSA